ncbi:MAG: WD40-like beta Propeller containing protein [Gemmatimonadetes bacterium]|nr:WD40-like beta Propeller containing protein [Gemmatimonadota bacterium]
MFLLTDARDATSSVPSVGSKKRIRPRIRPIIAAVLAALLFLVPTESQSQIDPSHHWLTLETTHFRVNFTRTTEPLARRIAADAERAYTQLSKDLHPPRGTIDIVVTDDIDQSNGSATPAPTNRIVIYANPPVSESALRYTNDWGQLVITHELTHIFHLDRTRGIWAIGQKVFGRAPLLFPNLYSPSWLTEGLAVYEESKVAGAGRIEGSEHRMIARAAAIDHAFPTLGGLSLAQGYFPFGETAYSFGSLFIDYIAKTQGESRVRDFVDKSAANIIPYLVDVPARQGFGISFSRAWKRFNDSIVRTIDVVPGPPLPEWRELTHDGVFVFAPRWLSDSSIVYSGTPGRETFGAFRVDLAGNRRRLGRRNSRSANVPVSGGGLLYSQLDFVNPYVARSDLWVQRGGREHQLTFGQRLNSPDARADGEIVAAQIITGATRLVRVSSDGKRITPITTGSYDEQWTEPRWSHDGRFIAASRWVRGNISQIVVIDTVGRIVHTASSGTSIEATPSWLHDDSGILYSSDRTGRTEVYMEQFTAPRVFTNAHTFVLSNAATGLFEPNVAPRSDRLASVVFKSDGYHLGVGAPNVGAIAAPPYIDTLARRDLAPVLVDSGPVKSYSAWHTFLPRYWLPTIDPGIDGGERIGGMTSGFDVIGRHSMTASLSIPTNDRGGIVGDVAYSYRGFGLPILQADVSQDWQSLGGAFSRDAKAQLIGEVFRRTRTANLFATWLRQRVRTAFALTGGVGLEHRTHVTTPSNVLALIDSAGALGSPTYPTLTGGASFTNTQFPPFAISPEDGIQMSVTVRDRTRSGAAGTGSQSFSTVAAASLFKSLDLPGFAHHVLALRGSAGVADDRAAGYYSVGGVNGSSFEVIPGYVIGEGRKTFPVRGFPAGTLIGTRALTGSAEYRVPLLLTGRSPGALPFFLDRSSLAFFGDFGTAWCPNVVRDREVCNRAGQLARYDIASVGAELNLNLGVLSWDSPYRFRLGVVEPTQNGQFFGQKRVQMYLVAGVSF